MADELVNVAVPRPYLAQVYRLIADLDDGSVPGLPAGATEVERSASDEILHEWSSSLISRMVSESGDSMTVVLRALAKAPGEWLSTTSLAKGLGGASDEKSVAGTLGAYGRRCYSRYKTHCMPFEKRYDYEVGSKVYRMAPEIAVLVLSALEDAK